MWVSLSLRYFVKKDFFLLLINIFARSQKILFCLVFSQYVSIFVVFALFVLMHGNGIKRSSHFFSFVRSFLHSSTLPFIWARIHIYCIVLYVSMCVCFRVFLKFIRINLRANGIHTLLPRIQFASSGITCSSTWSRCLYLHTFPFHSLVWKVLGTQPK